MDWFMQGIGSFLAAVGISVVFNAPAKFLVNCGVLGIMGWMTSYILIKNSVNIYPASFAGAFIVGILAHVLASYFKMPTILFNVAGIIPLVPGGMAYEAMHSIASNKYIEGLQYAANVSVLSAVIVVGLVFADVLIKLISSIKYRLKRVV
ncbi:threonine/serine exporter family protein [Clostridium cylindrosporum]|uniref:Threonine/Serine exporter ThrE domain-containing protein n=1 Tax=Clostridium cylindrosporum DSM 605 TaxID=1121307 RepID=A0A0J8G2L8_CLOCY|nr:threonine/serine exporter family protein [Clostridium cylindrosporum]KMT21966.1 hypothetical protein CLCY_3c02370 [Clostridium cylindrosporum DSM 605]